MTLGSRIRYLREQKGMNINALANHAGLTRSYLWELEQGKRANPSYEVLQIICEALGVSLAFFFEGIDDETHPLQETLLEKIKALTPAEQETLSAFLDAVKKSPH